MPPETNVLNRQPASTPNQQGEQTDDFLGGLVTAGGEFLDGIAEYLVDNPAVTAFVGIAMPALAALPAFQFLIGSGFSAKDQEAYDKFVAEVRANRDKGFAELEKLGDSILSQLQTLNGLTNGLLSENLNRGGGFSARFNKAVRAPVEAGFQNLRADTLQQLEGLGAQGRKDLQRTFANSLTQGQTDLTQRGLGGTSNLAALRLANAERRSDAMNAFNEQIRREQIDITTGIGLQGLAADERLRGSGFIGDEQAKLTFIDTVDASKRGEIATEAEFGLQNIRMIEDTVFTPPAASGTALTNIQRGVNR